MKRIITGFLIIFLSSTVYFGSILSISANSQSGDEVIIIENSDGSVVVDGVLYQSAEEAGIISSDIPLDVLIPSGSIDFHILSEDIFKELQNYEAILDSKISRENELRENQFELFSLKSDILSYSRDSQEFKDLEDKITFLQSYISSIQSEITEKKIDLTNSQRKVDDLSDQMSQLLLLDLYEGLEDQTAIKTNQLDVINKELSLAKDFLNSKNNDLVSYQKVLEDLKNDLSVLTPGTSEYEVKKSDIDNTEINISDIKKEISNLEDQIQNYQFEINALNTQINILNTSSAGTDVKELVNIPTRPSSFSNGTNLSSLLFSIGNVIRILIPIIFALALLYFFWGLAMFMRKAGGGENEEGKKKMLWGIIALFVMGSIWGIVTYIGDAFNIDTTQINQISSDELRR